MIVYSLPTCGQCKVLKAKLDMKGFDYQVVEDVEVMKEKGFMGVPVLELDDGALLRQVEAIKWVNAQEGNE